MANDTSLIGSIDFGGLLVSSSLIAGLGVLKVLEVSKISDVEVTRARMGKGTSQKLSKKEFRSGIY